MPGSDEPTLDPIAKVAAHLAQQVVSLWVHLGGPQILTTGDHQIQTEGEKL
jgi:hypothetical protein